MADENNPAAEAAAEAASAVVEQTEQIQARADDAIARAQADADAARAESDRIAAAALQTSLGQEIEKDRQGFSTWRTEHEARVNAELAKVPVLEQTVTELKSGLAMLLGALNPAKPSPSTPPNSDAPPTPEAEQVKPLESGSGDGHAQSAPPPAPSKRKHLL
jgi:hypothetical protein